MATTEWTVTTSVDIVLTTLCVTRPVDTARVHVKHHSGLLFAKHVRTKLQHYRFYTFCYISLEWNMPDSCPNSSMIFVQDYV